MSLAFPTLVFVKGHLDFSKHVSKSTKFSSLFWQEPDFANFSKGIFQDRLRAFS